MLHCHWDNLGEYHAATLTLRHQILLRTRLFCQVSALSRPQKRAIFLVIDIALVNVAFAVMFAIGTGIGSHNPYFLFVAVSGIAGVSSLGLGLPRIKLNAYGRHAIVVTGKFVFLVTVGTLILCQLVDIPTAAPAVTGFGLASFLGSIAARYCLLTVLLWILRQGQTRQRLVIYGAGDTGLHMALALRNHPRILPVAFLDDDIDLQAMTVAGLPVLSPARLENVVGEYAIDRVVLAMPSSSATKLAQITRKLQVLGLQVQAMPSFAQLAGTDAASASVAPDFPGQFLGRAVFSGQSPDVSQAYGGRVVLVSGAGGSVGSELCRQLITHLPKMLVLYEQSEVALYTIDRELRELTQHEHVQIVSILGSVTDAALARRTMLDTKTEVVLHAAAYKHVPLIESNPVAGLANNVIGTRIFAEAAVFAGVQRFLLISTDKAVRPTGVMGATKRLAELVVQDLALRSPKTRFSTVRFGNVLGSSGSVLPLFRDQIARGGPVTLTDENVTRYFMTLAEAAQLVLLTGALLPSAQLADIFVLDMGKPIKIRDLAERMIKAQGLTLRDLGNPVGDIEIIVTGLRPGEKLHEEILTEGPILPTPHPKVLRAQPVGLSEFAIASVLKAARAAIEDCDQVAARAVISACLDGFPRSEDQRADSLSIIRVGADLVSA